jgi:hypothetical protein
MLVGRLFACVHCSVISGERAMSMSINGMVSSPMPQIVSGASMRMPPTQKMENLFSQMDTTGSGSITKAQFEQALETMNPPAGFKAMGADAVFAHLDPNGSGSVSKQDFVKGMTQLMADIRHHHRGGGVAGTSQAINPAQSLASSLQSLNALTNQSEASPNPMVGANLDNIA